MTSAAGATRAVNREQAIDSALGVIDQCGMPALTIEKLAQHLDAAPSAVVRLFDTWDELLDGIVEAILGRLDTDPQVQPTGPEWQEFLYRLAHGFRRLALAHPQVFPLLACPPSAAPWLQPPLRSLHRTEIFLDALNRFGFSDQVAAAAYQTFFTFLLGNLLLEVAGAAPQAIPVAEAGTRRTGPGELDSYPRVNRLEQLTATDPAAEFEEALESVLDRLEHRGRQ